MRGKALIQQGGVMVPNDQVPIITLQKYSDRYMVFGQAVNFLRCGCPRVKIVVSTLVLEEGSQIGDDHRYGLGIQHALELSAKMVREPHELLICTFAWEDENGKNSYNEVPRHPRCGFINVYREVQK